ncbi:unnamed protein product [Caenorhabditis nigoni]
MWWWFKWLPKDNLDVRISAYESDSFELTMSSEVVNSGRVDYTEERFLNLKFKTGLFDSTSVTEEVFNQFKKEDDRKDRKLDVILQGIDFRVGDENFKDEVSIKKFRFVMDFESICG